MNLLVTGGCGFIGSNFVRYQRAHHPEDRIVVLDALTYAGNPGNLYGLSFSFVQGDIADRHVVECALTDYAIDAIVHFAAESHVDRSIHGATEFVRTNVLGTQVLLDAARAAGVKRFVHVSTDEVYGSLGPDDPPFTEDAPIRPNSPYAASKAAADMIVRAYVQTHGFPAIITRCSNNYGPYQFPEKLIPLMIMRAMAGETLPVYGDGLQVRDWIHVEDHCAAVDAVLRRGRDGEVYNIGAGCEIPNLAVVRRVIDLVGGGRVEHVTDRPGHDRRYAVDASKLRRELGWAPSVPSFVDGLRETVRWYREHEAWWRAIQTGEYRAWMETNYGKRGAA